mgnify:CR=1 FL=1
MRRTVSDDIIKSIGVINPMFHSFKTQEERRACGGSAVITRAGAGGHIQHWRNDSLYVHADDIDAFYQEYSRIFDCGTYNNMKTGVFDLYGINYYAPALIDPISEKLNKEKPEEYEALAAWLSQAKAHNGFYIFGI